MRFTPLLVGLALAVLGTSVVQAQDRFFTQSGGRGLQNAKMNARVAKAEGDIGIIFEDLADIEDHARATAPSCSNVNDKIRWTGSDWSCDQETDPTVQEFAKTPLPVCSDGEVLSANGNKFECVGDEGLATEVDPTVQSFAKAPLPSCTDSQKLISNGTALACGSDQQGVTSEVDPTVAEFAKDSPPSCGVGEVLKSNGSSLFCVSDDAGITEEVDPNVQDFALDANPLPTCGDNEVLKADGTTLTCVADAGSAANAIALSDLSDVSLTTPAAAEILSYDGTGWTNAVEADPNVQDFALTANPLVTCAGDETLTADGTAITCKTDAGSDPSVYSLGDLGDVDTTGQASGDFLKFNGVTWIPGDELDPLTEDFAKTTLPTCGVGEVLKGDGTSLSCIADAGSSADPTAFNDLADVNTAGASNGSVDIIRFNGTNWVASSDNIGTLTAGKLCQESGGEIVCTFDKPITCNSDEVLTFNGTTWVCSDVGSGIASGIDLGDLGDVDVTGAASGNVLAFDGSDWVDTEFSAISQGDSQVLVADAGAGAVQIQTDGVAVLTADSDQEIGIGTTSPSAKLDVVGNTELNGDVTVTGTTGLADVTASGAITVTGNVSANIFIGDGSGLTNIDTSAVSAIGADKQIQFNDSGAFAGASNLYWDESTDRLGIGTDTPATQLEITGTATLPTVNIDAGTIDGTSIGSSSAAQGFFTEIDTSSVASLNSASITNTLTVGGDATIAGTLQVLGALNISGTQTIDGVTFANGGIDAASTITATAFSGSGAALTGVTASAVDWYNVTSIPTGVAAISSTALTAGELGELQNIDAVTITNTQWGYLGAADQQIATSDDVTFSTVTSSGVLTTAGLNSSLDITTTGNVDAATFTGDGSALTGINAETSEWYGISNIPTGVQNISNTALSPTNLGFLQSTDQAVATTSAVTFDDIEGTGVASLNSASITNTLAVGGNTTIGGTLTVTGALNVSGTQTIDGVVFANGGVDAANTITASAFSGDGSGLTGVAASSVDWYNVSNIPTGVSAISTTALSAGELGELQNIDAVTITNTQWGYLGAADQGLATTDAVTFDDIEGTGVASLDSASITNTLVVGGDITTAGLTSSLDITATGRTVTAGFLVGDGSGITGVTAESADWYGLTNIPTGVSNISTTALSSTNLGFLQSTDQAVATTSAVTFDDIEGTGVASLNSASITNTLVVGTDATIGGTLQINGSLNVSGTQTIDGVSFANGGLQAASTITATAFSGDGSDLTGVAASSVDWYGITSVPTGVSAISTTALTTGELGELQNIDAVTITNTQWGYLGAADQGLATTDAVTFDDIEGTGVASLDSASITNTLVVGGDITTAGLTSSLDITTTGNVDAATFTGDGSALTGVTKSDQSLDTTDSVTFADIEATGVASLDSASITNTLVVGGDITTAGLTSSLDITTTGNVDADTLTIANNATIGGTLQINGSLNVSGTQTIDGVSFANGGLQAASTITATAFSGDGSDLTGVAASSVDWYGITSVPTGVSAISTTALSAGELGELQNIDAVTITNTQWGYLGAADQALATTDAVTFDDIEGTGVASLNSASITNTLVVGGDITTAGLTSSLDITTTGNVGAATLAGTLTTAAQTNITSLGTLNDLDVSGAITATGNIDAATFTGDGSALTGVTKSDQSLDTTDSVTFADIEATGVASLDSASITNTLAVGGDITTAGLTSSLDITTTGNVDADTLTIANNATVGGTLQINGSLNVSGTQTIDGVSFANGGLQAASTITATAFSGDGSDLTGVAASSVDWYGITSVPTGVSAISTTALSAGELGELQNIDAVTITNTQWGYLGATDQGLTTASNVTFADLVITDSQPVLSLTDSDSAVTENAYQSFINWRGSGPGIAAQVGVLSTGSQVFTIRNNQPAGIAFQVSTSTSAMNISEDGNVGIGSSSPGHNLIVLGDDPASAAHFAFGETAAANTPSAEMLFLGTGVQNGGLLWNPGSGGSTGKFQFGHGGGADPAAMPDFFTAYADGDVSATGALTIAGVDSSADITTTGNVDADTLTIANNATIGGTLQINGSLNVSGTQTIDGVSFANGGLQAASTITATAFSGDGSDLTGVAASSVDWYGITSVPTGVSAISTTALTTGELGELQNIDAVTITNTQWGYLGAADQGLATTDAVTFDDIEGTGVASLDSASITNTLVVGGDITTAGLTSSLDITTTGNVDAATFTGDGSALTGVSAATADAVDWYGIASVPTGVSAISTTALSAGELGELQNIDAVTITNTQWGYLGAADQGLATTDAVTFAGIDSSAQITVTGIAATADITTTGNVGAATLAGTLTTAAQTNITSLGTLNDLDVSGAVTATGNIDAASFSGDGSALTNLPATTSLVAGDSSITVVDSGTGLLNFDVDNNRAITVNATGVGISTTNPRDDLQIGDRLVLSDHAGNGDIMYNAYFDGSTWRRVDDEGAAVLMQMQVPGSQNLGFYAATDGTATADTEITWGGMMYLTPSGVATGAGGKMTAGHTSNGGSILNSRGNLSVGDAYYSSAAPTNGAIIEGDVGIGTSSPNAELDVIGTVSATQVAVTGDISATGGISATNFQGDGSLLTNVTAATADAVDWYGITSVPTGVSAISTTALSAGELGELQNIDAVTITNTQWGYLGATDQALATTDAVTFAGIDSSAQITVTGIAATADITTTGNVGASTLAGTLTTAAQTNITSVGTLTDLDVSGAVTATGNIDAATFTGNGAGLTNLSVDSLTVGLNDLTDASVTYTGVDSLFIGQNAGAAIESGQYNVGIGEDALKSLTTANFATVVGYRAGEDLTTAGATTLVGYLAGANIQDGIQNTVMGQSALTANISGNRNVAVGNASMMATTSSDNTGLGNAALQANTSNGENTAVGGYAMQYKSTGANNTAVGFSAGQGVNAVTAYENNTFIGHNAGKATTVGGFNTVVGSAAGDNITEGQYNIMLGYAAGNVTTGDRNIIIRASGSVPSAAGDDQLNIGNTIYGDLAGGDISVTGGISATNFQGDGSALTNVTAATADAVDWYGITSVPTGVSAISTTALSAGELGELQNIDAVTITNTQWGYLGAADQALATTDAVTFDDIEGTGVASLDSASITNTLVVGGDITTAGLTSSLDITTTGNVGAATLAGTLTTAAQTNITSVGTLTDLDVSGAITATGNIDAATFTGDGSALTGVSAATADAVDWYGITSVPTGVDAISTTALTAGELGELQNIDAVTITNTQWGYLGATDQALATTDVVEFAGIDSSAQITVTGIAATADITTTGNVGASTLAGTLTTAAQTNITSVGTLTDLDVTGAITATGNIDAATFTGDGSALTGIAADTAGALATGDTSVTAVDSGTGTLNFDADGSRIMTMDATGLGIGTTAPEAALDVAGDVSVTGGVSITESLAVGGSLQVATTASEPCGAAADIGIIRVSGGKLQICTAD